VKPSRLRATLTGVALAPILAWTLFPIYWIATASFKTELALYAKPPQWLFAPILDNYTRVLTNIPFFQYLKNSLVVAMGTTLGSLVLGTLAGYGFARFRFRASEAVRFLVLVTRMAPRMVLVVPYFLVMQRLGLLDTYTGLLVAYVSFALPFSIWLLIGFFVDVPLDVEEAGMIDGCSRLRVLWRIVIPIAAPGLVVAAIFAFLARGHRRTQHRRGAALRRDERGRGDGDAAQHRHDPRVAALPGPGPQPRSGQGVDQRRLVWRCAISASSGPSAGSGRPPASNSSA